MLELAGVDVDRVRIVGTFERPPVMYVPGFPSRHGEQQRSKHDTVSERLYLDNSHAFGF